MERITATSILLVLGGLLIAKILSRTGNDKAALTVLLSTILMCGAVWLCKALW